MIVGIAILEWHIFQSIGKRVDRGHFVVRKKDGCHGGEN